MFYLNIDLRDCLSVVRVPAETVILLRSHPSISIRHIMLLIGVDIAQTRINLHPDKSLRQLSSSKLANRRIHAYHSVIAMSLVHPALLMFILFIVLRIRLRSLKFDFHDKRCYHSNGNKATGVGSKDKTTRPPPTLETTVSMCVCVEKGEMYLQVIIYQRLVMSGDVELNPGPLGGK